MVQKKRGLVVSPVLRQAPDILHEDEREAWCALHPDVEWYFAERLPMTLEGVVDFAALCEMYVEMIIANNIEVVVASTGDDSAVVHAHIAEMCPTIEGPTMESILLANHKVYCRQYVIPDEQNLRFCAVNLDDLPELSDIADAVGFPMVLKPACEAGSTLVHVVHCKDELEEAIADFKDATKGTYFDKFGSALLGLEEKYPYLKQRVIMAEEFVNITHDDCNIQTVEVAAYNGEAIPWVICDNVYWQKNPQCFLACATPSVQSADIQDKIWNAAKLTMKSMINAGFKNSLLNIETFTWMDGTVKVMEINPRLAYQCQPLYLSVYDGGDHLTALIDMQLGRQVVSPVPKYLLGQKEAPRYALNNYISTKKGGLASEIYDFKKAAKYEQEHKDMRWVMNLKRPTQELHDCQSGNNFAWTYTAGDSFHDCMRQVKSVSLDLLGEEHHNSLWDDSYDWPAFYAERLRHHQTEELMRTTSLSDSEVAEKQCAVIEDLFQKVLEMTPPCIATSLVVAS